MIISKNLGLIEYSEALKIQEARVAECQNDPEREFILICEHPSVITVGRASGASSEVSATEIPVVMVSRGGRATLHTAGQVVAYPVFNLNKRTKDLHKFMRALEEGVINTLHDFRIESKRVDGKTGVWVTDLATKLDKKIASLGIAAKKWVTYHGVALNVTCDLNEFKSIQPCGFDSEVMTNMMSQWTARYQELWEVKKRPLMENVKERLAECLREVLEPWK
ncbi:MAG: lipoyl(octanoyl) transferase LipB [Oligoflexia bacterium]|nr:lipoyl(octanoyl) transferase LipB [Oligoflexia bacterium]